MSLTICPYNTDPLTNEISFVVDVYFSKIVGVEILRKTLYGSPPLRSLGLKLLPLLESQDLFVEGEDLVQLRSECEIILNNLDRIKKELGFDHDFVTNRIQNILDIIQIVKENNYTGLCIQ
jgi:hypothetical protein